MRLPFPANEDRLPGKALEASDGGLAHAFDTTEGGNSIKGGATVLQSIGVPHVEQNVFPQIWHW
jgi:hypothetical protein